MKNLVRKNILAVIALFLMTPYLINAQTDERNRVTTTIIADALNLMPANDKASEEKLMMEIINTGPDGVAELAKLLQPSSVGGNAKVEYALDGLCDFISGTKNRKFKDILADGLFTALDAAENYEVKTYLISLFQKIGDFQQSERLAKYINNAELFDVIVTTIASIPMSGLVLKDIALKSEPKNRCILAYGIANQKVASCEDMLIQWLDDADVKTQEAVYYALSIIGGDKSLQLLSAKAKSLKYNYEPTDVTASYIRILGKYASKKDVAAVEPAALALLKSKKANIRVAALNLLAEAENEKSVDVLLKLLKDKDKQVRTSALECLKPYADSLACTKVVAALNKKNTAAEAASWLGDIKCKTQMEFLENQLTSNNPEAVTEAIKAIVKIGDDDGMMTLLPLFGTEYQPVIKSSIASTKNNFNKLVLAALDGSDQQKIAALNIIEARTFIAAKHKVKRLLESDNQDVKAAAYKALKNVCDVYSAEYLRELLQKVDNQYVQDVQNAIIQAMAKGNDGVRENFVSLTKYISPEIMPRFYRIFACFYNEISVSRLMNGYRSETTRTEALNALLSIENVNIADTLYNIGISDYANQERIMERYVYLINKSNKSSIDKLNAYRSVLGLDSNKEIKNMILKYIEANQSYQGIMLAANYLDDESAQQAANTILNIATKHPEFNGKEITELLVRIKEILNDSDAMYKRTQIDEHLQKIAQTPKFELSDEEKADGFVVLFDGTNLDSWVGDKTDYIVQNGNIYVTANYGDEGNLYTAKEYADFVYRFEFCFTRPGVNNGVGIRTDMHTDAAYYGMEIQILDHDAPIYAGLRDYQVHGSVYGVIPAKRIVFPELGTWNTEEIYAKGDHIRVIVNGEVIVDGDIRKACNGKNMAPEGVKNAVSGTIDHNNHPGLFNKSGKISFCGHGEGLLIRNVRIKEL